MMHNRFMGHQSYVLLCRKITSFPPSEEEFSEKLGMFSKVKIFQNTSCYILEKINENYDNQAQKGFRTKARDCDFIDFRI